MTAPVLGLQDERACIDVTHRYCWAIDERDWSELARVFTADAVVRYGFIEPLHGLASIQSYVAKVISPLDASQHMVTNHQFFREDEALRSRCYFQAQHVRRDLEGGANYIVAGIYRDLWSDSSAGWRIRSRELDVVWNEGNPAVIGLPPGS